MSVTSEYRQYVLNHHKLPKNTADLGSQIIDISSIKEVEQNIWKEYAETTLEQCVNDPSFGEYIAREKMLAYTYSLLQNMSADEQLIQMQFPYTFQYWTSDTLDKFKLEFLSFVKVLIEEGQERGEIQKRPFINKIYPELFWNTMLSILIFWSKDTSAHKEQTDVAVEKWVNLLFDTIAPNALDSAVDLAQFMFKRNFNGNTK